jgi:hypothetical protein
VDDPIAPDRSERTAVEMLNWERGEIDAFKTANVHGGHVIPGRIDSFTEGMYSALCTEPMLDGVCAKRVGTDIGLWCEQP